MASKLSILNSNGKTVNLVNPDTITEDVDINLDFTLRKPSQVASSVMSDGAVSLSNFINTKNFDAVTYTGNGTSQAVLTGIPSIDLTDKTQATAEGSIVYFDRTTFEIKATVNHPTELEDAVIASGETAVNTSKIHIKSLDEGVTNYTGNNFVFDSLRGVSNYIITNELNTEATLSGTITSFNSNGFTVGNVANVNFNTHNFISYQTLYTHLKWGVTNQNKKYIEAFNPITGDNMVIYEGSGIAGQEIPHSLGSTLAYADIKGLGNATSWLTYYGDGLNYLSINNSNAEQLSINAWNNTPATDTELTLGVGANVNTDTETYIMYGKAKSENQTVLTYNGTGAAGNFIETVDANGIPRKPARVTTKRIDDISNWDVFDNTRTNDGYPIRLNTSDVEQTGSDLVYFSINGFTLISTSSDTNAVGGQFIAIVEFDTNADGGGSYFDLPTDDSNLTLTNPMFNYTDGRSDGSFTLLYENLLSDSVDFTGVTDGMTWVGRDKTLGTYRFEKKKPNVGFYNKSSADDNRLVFDKDTGYWYETTGGELVTNGTFDTDTAGWTPQDAILSVLNGSLKLEVSTNATEAYARQTIITEVGKKYTFKAYLDGLSSGFSRVAIGTVGSSSAYYQLTGEGYIQTDFVAETTETQIQFSMGGGIVGDYALIDGVTVFKTEPTLSTQLNPLSFLKNPVMVSSETPQYIDYSDYLPDVIGGDASFDSLIVKGIDLPIQRLNDEYNRKLYDVSSERLTEVDYKNNETYTIIVKARFQTPTEGLATGFIITYPDGTAVPDYSYSRSISNFSGDTVTIEVPPGATYKAINATVSTWYEYK